MLRYKLNNFKIDCEDNGFYYDDLEVSDELLADLEKYTDYTKPSDYEAEK